MAGFSAVEAALEGFRLTRENPRAFGVWVGLNIAVNILAGVIDVIMPASVRHGLDALGADQVLTIGQFVDALILAAPVLVLALTVLCMMAAAVYRLIFRHDDARFGYVRLGADEFRLMATTLACFFILMFVVVATTVLTGIIVAIINSITPLSSGQIYFLTLLGVVGSFSYFFVRFSLAPVATFAERRVVVFESWSLTRGHFWRLFGAYSLMAVCIFMVFILVLAICFGAAGAIVLAAGGKLSDVRGVFDADGKTLASYLSVGVIAYMLVSSVFSALYNAVIAAPGAVAYQALHGWPPASRPLAAQPEVG